MSTNQSQALDIQLRVPKENYAVGESIDATLVLKNHSNAPITINKRMGINPEEMAEGYWEVRFDITFPPEMPAFPSVLVNRGEPDADDFTLLLAGEEFSKSYTLTNWNWMQFLGTYEVKAIYNNSVDGSQFGLSAWTGEITSNSVSLEVTE